MFFLYINLHYQTLHPIHRHSYDAHKIARFHRSVKGVKGIYGIKTVLKPLSEDSSNINPKYAFAKYFFLPSQNELLPSHFCFFRSEKQTIY